MFKQRNQNSYSATVVEPGLSKTEKMLKFCENLVFRLDNESHSKLGQPGSIPALVQPSGGTVVRRRKGATAERWPSLIQFSLSLRYSS
ncbi:hypothetical protein T265_00926 [Opisthorchis viverrini]|uniref:Uncharacterized protein n=1 Tax=Opisthorchis viverrini TaxID=6198 RepID=A0A075A1M2_OPIVI|nr:hypothetical protein T265_00926 [Opisthorchis viverrini]KER33241.1 hypothetical protein T265_00926 [Opisthorchis viverrini]